VRDLGSLNGTFVYGTRCSDETVIGGRALLKFGDVSLWFLAELADQPPARSIPTITGGAAGGVICYELVHRATELRVFATDRPTAGGALLARAVGGDLWSERGLAPLEFQLLRALCVRGAAEAALPSSIRGCVATTQLVRDLPFQSKYANQDNVRQVVLRLRSLLAELGARDLLAVVPGRGYYLACQVKTGGACDAPGSRRSSAPRRTPPAPSGRR